jgi:hypothetical protein
MASAFRNTTVKMFLICSVCLLGSGWGVPSAVANETYSYTGNNYGLCTGSYAVSVAPGFTACGLPYRITGSFTTTLDPFHLQNLTNFTIPSYDIASFSFSDGSGLTINQSNARTSFFEISTNSSGNIIDAPTGWGVLVVGQTIEMGTGSPGNDFSQSVDSMGHATDTAYGQTVFENPGKWDGPAPVPTPEPSTLFLFGTGLLGLMGMGVRKKRLGTSTTMSSEK